MITFKRLTDNAVIVQCLFCPREYVIKYTITQQARVSKGEHIQKVAPELSANHRELLISGTCPPCFDAISDPDIENEADEVMTIRDNDNDDSPRPGDWD